MASNSSDHLKASRESPLANVASGCLYAVYVVGLSAGMLFVNALFCLSIYPTLPKPDDEQWASRVGQLFFFTVPLIMLVIEWHLLDRLQRLFRSAPR